MYQQELNFFIRRRFDDRKMDLAGTFRDISVRGCLRYCTTDTLEALIKIHGNLEEYISMLLLQHQPTKNNINNFNFINI